ncbi:MAG: DciA family protein [Phycisphaerae bacterium]
MTERHYRQLLQNCRNQALSPVFADPASANLLRAAARGLRERERARRALESLLDPAWLGVTRVDRLERGMLTLGVADAAAHAAIRRQLPQLERQLARRIPRLRRLRVTFEPRPGADSA